MKGSRLAHLHGASATWVLEDLRTGGQSQSSVTYGVDSGGGTPGLTLLRSMVHGTSMQVDTRMPRRRMHPVEYAPATNASQAKARRLLTGPLPGPLRGGAGDPQ